MNGSDAANGAGATLTRVLIADDQEMIRTGFRLILGTQPDLEVTRALAGPGATVRLLKHLAGQQPAPATPHPLSEREMDVVRLLAVGRTNQEIRDELYLSLGTVKTHLADIKDKLGVRNRVEIAAWAWDTGRVRPRQAPHGEPVSSGSVTQASSSRGADREVRRRVPDHPGC